MQGWKFFCSEVWVDRRHNDFKRLTIEDSESFKIDSKADLTEISLDIVKPGLIKKKDRIDVSDKKACSKDDPDRNNFNFVKS